MTEKSAPRNQSANSHTSATVKNDNLELQVQRTTTDAPLLPIAQLERMHAIDPKLVDWMMVETAKESDARRAETRRINDSVIDVRMRGQNRAFALGFTATVGGIACVLFGFEWAGAVIATTGLAGLGLAAVFLTGRESRRSE